VKKTAGGRSSYFSSIRKRNLSDRHKGNYGFAYAGRLGGAKFAICAENGNKGREDMGSRVEEYLRRMRERGYSDSLMGMDDEDIEWELSKMEEADRRREAVWQQPQPTRTVYRPVDPGLKARILRMFGQPYDESAIPKGQEFYLNGWDNGEEEMPELNPGPYVPAPPGKRGMKPDLHDTMYNPVTGKITKIMDGGFEIKGWELPGQGPFGRNFGGSSPSRGEAVRPLSYTTGGNDGGQGTNTAANPYAGGYADGGAYGDMTLPEGAARNQGQGTNTDPNRPPQIAGGDHLGYLSANGESSGNPGVVSGGQGDPGGKSYGAFQFSSNNDVPTEFVTWLADNNPDVHARLQRAYNADGNNYGPAFDAEWQKIAAENPDAFLNLQYAFTKQKYYDPAVAAIKKETGFDFNNKSYALRNVLWSRAVQHGSDDAVNVIKNAFKYVDLNNEDAEEIIKAIYKESGSTDSKEGPYITEEAIRAKFGPEEAEERLNFARKHNLIGKPLKYYGGSIDNMLGVWNRLNIDEPQAALELQKRHR